MSPLEAVAHYVSQQPPGRSFCVAYSAGMDSHVLLHLMTQLRDQGRLAGLRALHVDHGLQAESPLWSEHAMGICQALSVPLQVRKAMIDDQADSATDGSPESPMASGHGNSPMAMASVGSGGPEATARKARYALFAEVLQPDEHLLLAQHAEDQAETFLLQALRGSGPDGLAGIPRKRRFAAGYMGRPLLVCSQDSLRNHAREHGLQWIDDPSNLDHRFDRNFLRHQVMPLLKTRWPAASETLSRSALRSAAASQSLLVMARQDLDSLRIPGTSELSIAAISALPRERAFTALRLYIRERGLRMPRLQDLVQVMENLVNARADSAGIVNVRDYEIRRHRDRLHVLPAQAHQAPFRHEWQAPFEPLTISETGLTLTRELCRRQGMALPSSGSVIVKSRAGGELIQLGEPAFHKSVKKILQESAIPPWIRQSIPLLYYGDRLAAVWNLAVAVDCRLPVEAVRQSPDPSADEADNSAAVAQDKSDERAASGIGDAAIRRQETRETS